MISDFKFKKAARRGWWCGGLTLFYGWLIRNKEVRKLQEFIV
jgi:hypothetical protein